MPKDTEQDLVLEPAVYWEHFLEAKLKNALLRKRRPLESEYNKLRRERVCVCNYLTAAGRDKHASCLSLIRAKAAISPGCHVYLATLDRDQTDKK
jgi:hypothetical protein